MGYAPGGVAIYSSDYSSLDPRDYDDDAAFRSYIDDEYMGHKWQCVEFARRFLFLNYGVVFTDVGMAWEIFSLRFLREVLMRILINHMPIRQHVGFLQRILFIQPFTVKLPVIFQSRAANFQ